MAEHDSKADTTLPQIKKPFTTEQHRLIEQLSQLEDRLNNLLACYRFMGEAVRAMTEPERGEEFEDWQLGLFLNQQWVQRQGEQLINDFVNTKLSLKP